VDRAKLIKEIRGWTITILAVLAFRTFLYEAVYIPSGSMLPTLQIGDYVIVEKWAYGARLPFTRSAQATWREPSRGDIVVLLAP
jgi:signal peptidase I